MGSLNRLGSAAASALQTRRFTMRAAVVGAVTYLGFTLEMQLGEAVDGHFSARRLLVGVGFGIVAGLLMGAIYGGILGRFRQRGFLAHQLAGVAAGSVLMVAPVAVLGRSFLAFGLVGALLVGCVLGFVVWFQSRHRNVAA